MIKVRASRVLMWAAVIGLCGCANIPQKTLGVSADQAIAQAKKLSEQRAPIVEEVDADLPDVELSAETLELLLTQHFASYGGDWSRASDSALRVAEATQDYRVARSATLLALKGNDFNQTLKGAALWAALKPDDSDATNVLLVSNVGSGNVDDAFAGFEANRGEKGLDEHIRKVAGLVVKQTNASAAIAVMQKYAEREPESAQVMLSAAFVAQTFKQYRQAEQWIDESMRLRPDWDAAAQMKVELLSVKGSLLERSEFIVQYAKAHPSSVMMNLNYAADLARQKEYQRALDVMKAVIATQPNDNVDNRALRYSGALAQQLGDNEQAKRYYSQALGQDSSDDDARWSLARIALIEEKYVTAERLYNDIEAPESFIRAQIQVATARYHLYGIERALATLSVLEPMAEHDYVDLALARHGFLLNDRQYEEAFGQINEVLLYLPDNLDLLYARALVAAELNKVDVAERDFRIIIAQHPEHADALNALGYTLADQTQRYEEAKVFISKALAIRPQAAHILDSMGWVLYRLNDYGQAIEFLEKAYKNTKEVEIGAHLGEVYWESGNQDKARAVWQGAFQKDADNPVLKKTLNKYDVSFGVSNADASSSDK